MPDRKVLLIGWDAADWQVARPLIEAGKMPNLKALMDEGVWGNLATIRPVLSPMLWTSIATGKRAWKHGIHGFSEPEPRSGGIRPISNLSRKTKAVWNIFNQQGWKTNVIGWWPSHPAEPVNGVMVSNHFQQAMNNLGEDWPMRPGTVHPKELEEPLKEMRVHPAELENEHILPFIPKAAEIDQEKDKRMESCAKIIAEVSGIHAATTACMQLEPWDFMAAYYDAIDHFGHGFMKYHPPRQPWVKEEDFELYKDVIEAGYRYHDMMLGVLIQLAGKETTVLLISDHGFEPGNLRPKSIPNEPAGPAAEHSPFGMFVMRGPGIRKGEQIYGASLLDIAPTLLHLYGLPVGWDMDGKVLVNCFEETQQIDYIDSWDDVEGPEGDGRHPAGAQMAATEARESIKQLVDLGYIDEPNPDQAKAVDETRRELQYNLVQAYMDAGRYGDAMPILRKLWDRWPEESRFGVKLLGCHLSLEDAEGARTIFDRLVERKQAAVESSQEEIKTLTEELKKKLEEAGKEFPKDLERRDQQRLRRLRGHAGTNQQAMAFLEGSVLALEGKHDDALAALKKAEAVQTANRPSLYTKLGEMHIARDDLPAAEEAFSRALEIAPNNHDAHFGLARVHLRRERWYEAAAEALASLELIFHNPRAHFTYGRALMGLKKFKVAEQTLLTAVSQNWAYPDAHRLLARLYSGPLKKSDLAARHKEMAVDAEEAIRENRERRLEVPEAPLADFPKIEPIDGRIKKEDTQPLVVVSGLPRSGTSLMMQMLKQAGVPILTDDERQADDSNPRGYFEDDRIKRLPFNKDASWLKAEAGKAVKIIAPLLPYVPEDMAVRILFTQRSAREVLTSQRTMLERDNKAGAALDDAVLAEKFAGLLGNTNDLLEKRNNWELLPVDYDEALADPEATARTVLAFLGLDADAQAVASVVDPKLNRSGRPATEQSVSA
ncbi:MAG: alkaline phosphatase family protein [Opitutales bacterium]